MSPLTEPERASDAAPTSDAASEEQLNLLSQLNTMLHRLSPDRFGEDTPRSPGATSPFPPPVCEALSAAGPLVERPAERRSPYDPAAVLEIDSGSLVLDADDPRPVGGGGDDLQAAGDGAEEVQTLGDGDGPGARMEDDDDEDVSGDRPATDRDKDAGANEIDEEFGVEALMAEVSGACNLCHMSHGTVKLILSMSLVIGR